MRYISSQTYRDRAIINARIQTREYGTVSVVSLPELGDDVAVVLDGHHSLCAALANGETPEVVEVTDADSLRGRHDDLDAWLLRHIIDGDYRWLDEQGYPGTTVF